MFSTLENRFVGISGAEWMKVIHFLPKNMFWENAIRVFQKQSIARACQTFTIVFSTPWKPFSRHFWSWRKESNQLSMQKYVLWKCSWRYLWNGELLELSNLFHWVQHPRKLTNRHFWSSRNWKKAHFVIKNVCLTKYCESISDTWWMLELSNLCHCVQDTWKTY